MLEWSTGWGVFSVEQISRASRTVRFGAFEVDLRVGELRKHGLKIKLQVKPFQVLAALLEHTGDMVTREELREKLWPGDTFVDFDHSINIAIYKLREALADSAENPRFVETLDRRGYRFIAPVEPIEVENRPSPAPPSMAAGQPAGTDAPPAAVGASPPAPLERQIESGKVAASGASPGRIMLAVLPFDNLSGSSEQDYFSDGLTEEMIAQLGRLRPARLGIIARTSAMTYKHTTKTASQIGRELGVDYMLEGSVRRAQDRVRITAQLIQASDQTHLWVETYDRKLADILDIQRDVAERVARSLALELLPGQEAVSSRASTRNPAAYEAYLRGRYYWNRRAEDEFRMALGYFQQALETDPHYARAHVGVADSYILFAAYHYLPPKVAFPRARAAAIKALEIDDRLAEAHSSLAAVSLWHEWDWQGAEKTLQRALGLDPSYAPAHYFCAHYFMAMGRYQEGIQQMTRARELDPLSLSINATLGWAYYLPRQYDRAIAELRKTLDMDPEFLYARHWLGQAYAQTGRFEEAITEFHKAIKQSDNPLPVLGLGHTYAIAGRKVEALQILGKLEKLSTRKYITSSYLAAIYAGLGENDQAFEWLEKAFAERALWLIYIRGEPMFDSLRADARYQDLVRRIGLPP